VKERANAILFVTLALALVAWWVWPKAYMPIGDLHNRDIIGAWFRDANGAWFRSTDGLFLSRLAHDLDQVERIPEVIGRQSRGGFDVVLELKDDDPVRLYILCHSTKGPVIHFPGDFAGPSLDSAMLLLQWTFPEGSWCGDEDRHPSR
jgi:hypothetical protein